MGPANRPPAHPALAAKTLRAAGLLFCSFVVTGVTARCGCSARPVSPKTKIPCRSTPPNFQTGAQASAAPGCVPADIVSRSGWRQRNPFPKARTCRHPPGWVTRHSKKSMMPYFFTRHTSGLGRIRSGRVAGWDFWAKGIGIVSVSKPVCQPA